MNDVYDFARQFENGKAGEEELDAYFGRRYTIYHVNRDQERCGIDRIFVNRRGERMSIEYKTDTTAGRTRKVFIETVSGDAIGRKGWVYTCSADRLLYYVPAIHCVYVCEPKRLRQHVRSWLRSYELKAVSNLEYHTYGVLVPCDVFENAAEKVIHIPPPRNDMASERML